MRLDYNIPTVKTGGSGCADGNRLLLGERIWTLMRSYQEPYVCVHLLLDIPRVVYINFARLLRDFMFRPSFVLSNAGSWLRWLLLLIFVRDRIRGRYHDVSII